MLQQVPIRCPCCGKMVECLDFWRTSGNLYLHLCKDCINKDLTDDDLIRIGYYKAVGQVKDVYETVIRGVEVPDIFPKEGK